MPRFTINEPHPTVAKNSYIQAGRGGAGNHIRAPVTTPSAGVVTEVKPLPPTSSTSTRFYSGRGGAGNAHSKSESPVFQFDEEYARKAAHESNLRGHTGRGGAGNAYAKTAEGDVVRKSSIASSHRSSTSSNSERSGFLARLTSRSSKN